MQETADKKPTIRQLVFGEGLMIPALTDDKYFTIRKFREGAHDFKKDEIIQGVFKDGLNVLLRITADSKIAHFKELKSGKRSIKKNGYWFDKAYFEDLKLYYGPELSWEDMGAVVFHQVLKVDGVPVVSVNEYVK